MSSATVDKINYLLDTKEEIRQAIVEKYVDVPTSATFRSYANSIRAIPTGNKTCRFVIGTSTAGWTGKDCDYLCDGVDDQVEINAAIQALPNTGGEIKVLDGTYNITASINIDKERVTFGGCGQSTIFKRMWKGSSESDAVITFSKSYCTFKDFTIEGNKSVYAGGSGVYLTQLTNTNILVENVFSNNNEGYGIYLGMHSTNNFTLTNNTCSHNNCSGIFMRGAENCIITGNTCYGNNNDSNIKDGNGIYLGLIDHCTVTGNICYNNRYYGIYTTSANYSTVTGNTCYDNNIGGINIGYAISSTVTGNTCYNNVNQGIYMIDADYSTVTGNTCYDNDKYGLYTPSAKCCTIIGNTILRGKGTSSDYTSYQHNIYMGSDTTDCVIVGNNCSGKPPTVAGTGNIVENNLS